MKKIRLVIFNEYFWDKGLIYTQNIQPLLNLSKATGSEFEILSFTPIPSYLMLRKEIASFRDEMITAGVRVRHMPILYYPTRYMLTRWFMLPFFCLNVMFYVLWLKWKDKNKDVVYNVRSYQAALAFYLFYKDKKNLVFDPRTDWIEENINAGNFNERSLTVNLWNKYEKGFISSFKRTIVISDIFRNNLIKKHDNIDGSKISICYNPIDYKLFSIKPITHDNVIFLYTGSFGQWNKIETYLDFFDIYHRRNSNSELIICTSSSRKKVESVLGEEKYGTIRNLITIYYNVNHEDLPEIYARCDYGLQLMKKKDSRVGVKFVEYVAAGLTPIVTDNVQGAAYLIDKFNLGLIIKEEDSEDAIYSKVSGAPKIDKDSSNYQIFKSLTDLNGIEKILKEILL